MVTLQRLGRRHIRQRIYSIHHSLVAEQDNYNVVIQSEWSWYNVFYITSRNQHKKLNHPRTFLVLTQSDLEYWVHTVSFFPPPVRIKPTTLALPMPCSTNWATQFHNTQMMWGNIVFPVLHLRSWPLSCYDIWPCVLLTNVSHYFLNIEHSVTENIVAASCGHDILFCQRVI